jgi:hypothetical protein
MSALRFSIANLLAVVALIGVGLAALNSPSSVIAGLLALATLAVILLAILGTVYRSDEARAFWLGVALFGGSYFVVALTPVAPLVSDGLGATLKTVRAAFWTVRTPDGEEEPTGLMDTAYDRENATTVAWPSWHHGFGLTIHCLANLLFAVAGGIAGRWFYATRPKAAEG